MKGIIFYYSGSGNTKLACEYIKKNIKNVNFDLYDIVKTDIPDISLYDVFGFATFTDFWGVPQYYYNFIEKIQQVSNKYAFVFNTYGMLSGKTLKTLANLVKEKKFKILLGFSLHMPENYPPIRKSGINTDKYPLKKEMNKFDNFIKKLDNQLDLLISNKTIKQGIIKIGFLNSLLPNLARTQAKKDIGILYVNNSLCNECGICVNICPYEAISLSPKAVFDNSKCFGCWACYNHCTQKAIYTKKFSGECQYPQPLNELVLKLK
ncbi:MAG: hypothetical protein A2086_10650 [Spirochaetes bacterium GWD1_27_9]|nr:MAG: hypothetical protein A2Z98_09080 [Spirochaetes bacterium GWB1_27_13]OHD26906.1 MAG: hypothetical protein A2Y34_09255 [Spirochaetes bacterium GWC1_27_15]OHD34880.1 MAG: hypothetical protein A2086_10650 [Spirochaetes bacterium GWD1_27_9]